MLLDRLEEQFDLPALAVDLGDCGCWQGQMIGQKDEAFVPRLPVVPPVTLDALVELVAGDDWAKAVFSAMRYPSV